MRNVAQSIILSTVLLFLLGNICPAQPALTEKTDIMTRLKQDIQAYDDAVSRQDSSEIAEASYRIAKRHINLGNYGISETWLSKSLRIQKKFRHFEDIGKIYLRFQEIRFILERPDEAIYYAQMAMLNFRKANSQKGMMSAYGALGTSYLLAWKNREQPPVRKHISALYWANHYFRKSLKLAQSIPSPIDEGQMYRYLGICAKHQNDIARSINLKIKASEVNEAHGLLTNDVELAIDIANQYMDLGNLESGGRWLSKAEKLLGNAELKLGLTLTLLDAQARYAELTEQWKRAYQYRQAAERIREESFTHYRNEAVEGVRKSEEAKLKEAALVAQKKELALLKNNASLKTQILYIVALLLVICALAAIACIKLYMKYKALSQYNAGLVKEQSHRTKNDLQIVSTLLSLQSHQLQDPAAAKLLEESLLRVESIILIHRQLYQDTMPMFVDIKPYLNDLARSILHAYQRKGVRLTLEIAPFTLHVKKTAPLALIVNELMTNACKYALTSPSPELRIHCEAISGQILLSFIDNGPGFDLEKVRRGFGLELIDMLCQQLGGSYAFYAENGSRFQLSFAVKETLLQHSDSHHNDPVFL